MTKSLYDLDAEFFIAEQNCLEAERLYDGLRRRGVSHRKADATSGLSKCERDFNRAADARLNHEMARVRGKPATFAKLQEKIAVLARWEERGLAFSATLAKIATGLLQPGALTDL
jgi:hypothetical protein